MAAVIHKSVQVGVLGIGAFALSVATLIGAGAANADPNDPSMTTVRGNGTVSSRQAASTSGAKPCAVNPGTLSTASTIASDVGTPTQKAQEAGPEWVGSRGWQAVGISPSNPWGGNFNPRSTKTGPQCRGSKARGFN
ncbi:hypothetical protein NGTWS0302_15470 [Mycolicibacterium cyprinidarum]|uniref:Uncharacterized protein n=1 Tax=Mycolicibacterium cyprinidarum TaxID=2860311 RepID=A0ABQ4V6U2_9MYCO|nr:hypothetical protein NGTWS1702_37230 [Mycolicibacterium sp. NGTWSNA01]GJF17901.1 hypothetical protein NGTWS1803_36280 [Mycolicibacterium sp. NGTWS1803]GJF17973.1 hypothetical protein NGTWS0302_15470 [Mycolicibacterium sp. NGTWS0302]